METLFNKILETIKKNNACAVATVVESRGSSPRKIGARMVVFKDGAIEGTIGGGSLEKMVIRDALAALRQERSFLKEYALDKRSGLQVCGGKVSIFIETIAPQKRLVVAGAGHIGLSLSFLGKLLGFDVIVVDERRAFACKQRFPHADKIICGAYRDGLRKVAPDKNTFVVIVTHGHVFDTECLEAALKTRAGYIGMIGSDTKVRHVFDHLLKKGFKKTDLARVHAPIGLEIGAETPEEITVSIAAELVKVLREEDPPRLRGSLDDTLRRSSRGCGIPWRIH